MHCTITAICMVIKKGNTVTSGNCHTTYACRLWTLSLGGESSNKKMMGKLISNTQNFEEYNLNDWQAHDKGS